MSDSVDYQLVADRIGGIRETIALRSVNPVAVVAVTKGFGIEAVRAAIEAGILDIGENYAQEVLEKQELLKHPREGDPPRWHFIGGLQRNKVKKLSDSVYMWQSIDSFALGEEVAKRCETPKLLVQVNMTGSENQGGVSLSQVPVLVEKFQDSGISVEGLMAIGQNADREATLAHFQNLKKLTNLLGLVECSMGMSNDYDLALEAGATILRLGTAIFGNRDVD
ncbi:MAG: YggS family pyridoxal phosphate-dependent enzyme [Acidimicrobiales bacterium]|nr:YggS family pyridoxal phosphate-dependent enzyme [Acidimicrobiales bacterium]